MSKRLLDRRWPWLAAAGAVVLALLSTVVEIRAPGDWDDRPLGSVDDIETLRDRDDLNVLFVVIDTLRAERLPAISPSRRGPRPRWCPSGRGCIPRAPASRASIK
jgi:hypothetical protein